MARELRNLPNREPLIFEAEWSGEGEVPESSRLIRQNGECPERLEKMIRNHYQKLKEALAEGKHLGPKGYFADHKKWQDVWEAAMRKGFMPDFSSVKEWPSSVDVQQGATLTAPALTEVAGYVYVREGGKLDAPKLKR